MPTTWSTISAARWSPPAGRSSICSPRTRKSPSTSTAPRWRNCAIRRTISARPAPWWIGCWRCAAANLLRRRSLGRGLLADEFLHRQLVDLAGAEQRQLVEHDDFGWKHQFGGVPAARKGNEFRARRAVPVGDHDEALALARIGQRRHRRHGV